MKISGCEIRKTMRISHVSLDPEIESNIQACLMELERGGVKKDVDSPLIFKACELYCKWQYDYQGKADQYKRNYEELRDSMSLSGGYKCTTKS